MSLTDYQRNVCRILAAERIAKGDRYVGGGAALNELLKSGRLSHDVDLFHDTREAVLASWTSDRRELEKAGYAVRCHKQLQSFGCLVWATCGKDPGLSPMFILEQASRSTHYSREDYETLAFEGDVPNPAELSNIWRSMLKEAAETIAMLPEDQIGKCVMTQDRNVFAGTIDELNACLKANTLHFHPGCIRGAWPVICSPRA